MHNDKVTHKFSRQLSLEKTNAGKTSASSVWRVFIIKQILSTTDLGTKLVKLTEEYK